MANYEPTAQEFAAPRVLEIIISPGHDYWVKKGQPALQYGALSVNSAFCLAGQGLRGDRYSQKRSGHKAQITLISCTAIEEIRRRFELPDLSAQVFRRNLIVSGLHLAELVGQQFQIQGVQFEGTEECRPCRWMELMVADGARAFMQENFRGGLRAKILNDGVLKAEAWGSQS